MEPIPIAARQNPSSVLSAPDLASAGQDTTSGSIRRETDTSKSLSLSEQKEKLRKSTKDFEAIFVRQLLKSMRSTLMDGGMFGSGTEGDIYSDMMENALADNIAERGILGLGDQLYRRLVTRLDPSEGGMAAPVSERMAKDLTSE